MQIGSHRRTWRITAEASGDVTAHVTCNRIGYRNHAQTPASPADAVAWGLLYSNAMRLIAIFGSLLLGVAACGGSSPAPASPVAHHETESAGDPSCPVAVPGTSVTVEDTDTGAALVFVTTGDVAELRRRVSELATMHNEQHGKMGPLPIGTETSAHDHGAHGGHAGHGEAANGGEHAGHAGGMISVHSRAEASGIDGGARLTFVVSSADVGKIQEELRMHAQHMASGSCEMGEHTGHH